MATFRCRKCRILLFSVRELESHTVSTDQVNQVSSDLASFDKCSSWFLKDEDILPWIAESVEEAQWTEGKIYCPKCKSRIGAFDFIHGIQCNCGKFTIPAIWIQKSRVDHVLPNSQITNLHIRYPVSFDPLTEVHLSNISEEQRRVTENDCKLLGLENVCNSEIASPEYKSEELGSVGVRYLHTHCFCIRNLTHSLCSLLATVHLPLKCVNHCFCTLNTDQILRLNPSANSTVKDNTCHMTNNHVGQKWKKIRKRQRQARLLEDGAIDLHDEMKKDLEASQATTGSGNMYKCLRVDEGFDKFPIRHQVLTHEIQDRHCCAVCLDLLYEPFKCSCDHVFCDPCLRQLNFRIGRNGTISCPLCRQTVEHVTPATELRSEIRNTYETHILRKREKTERRASYRKWPLPSGNLPSRRVSSRTHNISVAAILDTCIIVMVCGFLLFLVLTVVVQVPSD
ncbi:unnamed protein product [Porites lobata]|uniref:RING-type domain-containing protein n=1 Tax=Porites lobata TaxID=104759 RepID=A0ABN8Q120_9CNID|nr:unnamed protein product [Porites lobata]